MAIRQLSSDGNFLHLLTLEGLPETALRRLFALADAYADIRLARPLLSKLVINIFFETSTRTRTAFEATEKQLGADVVNLDKTIMADNVKRESFIDTIQTVVAMGAAGIILRHAEDGAAERAAMVSNEVPIINGGDGANAHPTQALTDSYTLRETFGDDFSGLSISIIGDVLHSRVARSNLHALKTLGVTDIRLVGPPTLCPAKLANDLDATVTHDINDGLDGADAVILLRIQRERLTKNKALTAEAEKQYFADYGLTSNRLRQLKKKTIIMHPGPVNRGIEIADEVMQTKNIAILRQVKNGMAIRAAVLSAIIR